VHTIKVYQGEGVQFWTGSIALLNLNFRSMYMGVSGMLHAPAALPPPTHPENSPQYILNAKRYKSQTKSITHQIFLPSSVLLTSNVASTDT
jgi:hypothetical protein